MKKNPKRKGHELMNYRGLIRKIVLPILFLIVTITGCGGFPPGPEQAVTDYLEALWRGDYKAAYNTLSDDDKTLKNFGLFKSEQEAAVEILRHIQGKSFEIRNVKQDLRSARVKVAFSAIEYGKLWKELRESYADSASIPSYNEIKVELIQRAKDGKIQAEYHERMFNVVKEGNDWKVKLAINYKPPDPIR